MKKRWIAALAAVSLCALVLMPALTPAHASLQCMACGGDGRIDCSYCGGTGWDNFRGIKSRCGFCYGRGWNDCRTCGGDGRVGSDIDPLPPANPTAAPTAAPVTQPTAGPTAAPTARPTEAPDMPGTTPDTSDDTGDAWDDTADAPDFPGTTPDTSSDSQVIYSGTCGVGYPWNIEWELYDDGLLVMSGEGEMARKEF